jgi:hypothetical protein
MPVTKPGMLSAADVRHHVGPVTEHTLLAILDCKPSQEELEMATRYLSGEAGEESRIEHPMAGKVAQIYDILRTDALYAEEED